MESSGQAASDSYAYSGPLEAWSTLFVTVLALGGLYGMRQTYYASRRESAHEAGEALDKFRNDPLLRLGLLVLRCVGSMAETWFVLPATHLLCGHQSAFCLMRPNDVLAAMSLKRIQVDDIVRHFYKELLCEIFLELDWAFQHRHKTRRICNPKCKSKRTCFGFVKRKDQCCCSCCCVRKRSCCCQPRQRRCWYLEGDQDALQRLLLWVDMVRRSRVLREFIEKAKRFPHLAAWIKLRDKEVPLKIMEIDEDVEKLLESPVKIYCVGCTEVSKGDMLECLAKAKESFGFEPVSNDVEESVADSAEGANEDNNSDDGNDKNQSESHEEA